MASSSPRRLLPSKLALILSVSICLFTPFSVFAASDTPSTVGSPLYLLDKFKYAKCIDGSSPGYYFRAGSDEGASKFMIHLEGGAWCEGTTEDEVLASCLARSRTNLGTSKLWASNFTNDAILDSSVMLNPAFHNWNIIYFKYCDGFAYQGNTQRVVNGTTLYFHGKLNTLSLFQDLIENRQILHAESVVFSGSSAGGIGATNWNEYLRNLLPKRIKMSTIIDSGFFTDDGWFNPKLWQLLIDIAYDNRREEMMPPHCAYLHDDAQLFKCVQPAYTYKQLTTPTLMLMSNYDAYVLKVQKKVACLEYKKPFFGFNDCNSEELAVIEELRAKTIAALETVQKKKKNISVWSVSCTYHMFLLSSQFYSSGIFEAPFPTGITAANAVAKFMEKPTHQISFIDHTKYPTNAKCSYLVPPTNNSTLTEDH